MSCTVTAEQLRELVSLVENGERAVILFLVQRACSRFATAADLDPAYAPDGSALYYASAESGDLEIYRLDFASGGKTRLTNAPGLDLRPRAGDERDDIDIAHGAGERFTASSMDPASGSSQSRGARTVAHSYASHASQAICWP